MSVLYVAKKDIDLGEEIHIRLIVKPKCETELPFTIRSARWELYYAGAPEASGDCIINGHEIDAFVSPKNPGRYCLKYIYKIADETWVNNVDIKAG